MQSLTKCAIFGMLLEAKAKQSSSLSPEYDSDKICDRNAQMFCHTVGGGFDPPQSFKRGHVETQRMFLSNINKMSELAELLLCTN